MAAPISPISIGAPAELVAPQPVAVNKTNSSNQNQQSTPFKQHLSNASDKHQSAKESKNDAAQQKNSQVVRENNTNEQKVASKSASSLNAADTNTARAWQNANTAQQEQNASVQKQADGVAASKASQGSESVVQVDSGKDGLNSANGKELPQTGKELPQTTAETKLPENIDTSITTEVVNASLLNIPTQPVTSSSVQSPLLPTAQVVPETNNVASTAQTALNLENSQSQKVDQSLAAVQSNSNIQLGQTSQTNQSSTAPPANGVSNTAVSAQVNQGALGAEATQNNPLNSLNNETNGQLAGGKKEDTSDLKINQSSQTVTSPSLKSVDAQQSNVAATSNATVTEQQPSVNQTQGAVEGKSDLVQSQKIDSLIAQSQQEKPTSKDGIGIQRNTDVNSEPAKGQDNGQSLSNKAVTEAAVPIQSVQTSPTQKEAGISEAANSTVNNLNSLAAQSERLSVSEMANASNRAVTETANVIQASTENNSANTAIKDNLLASAVKTTVEQSAQADKAPLATVTATGALGQGQGPQNNANLGQSQINVAESATPILDKSLALNQSLEKMRAGIDSTALKEESGESLQTKHASTKAITSAEGLQQLASMQNGLRSTAPVQMQMPPGTPPTSKNWGKAVADKVYIAASQNLRVANIHLDPPELGALQIRLQVTGPDQQMSVSFTSPHASVRDTLEQQLPRLREMLEEQGINLGESSVNDQRDGSGQMAGDGESKNSGGYADNSDPEGPTNPLNTQGTLALVDFYA